VNAEELAEWLTTRLPTRVSHINPEVADIHVRHVLNWGGFVNRSFRVTHGAAQYHLKLTKDPGILDGLQTWRELHSILENYRAPRLIDWVEFPEIGYAGILFEHIDARPADLNSNHDLLGELITTVQRLHQDPEIQTYLERTRPAKTRFDYFVQTYIDRFTADLSIIEERCPSFISHTLLGWMWEEVDRLREAANHVAAFHRPAEAPVHGDLHEGNILVGDQGWFIVDWDDLALGDPALEFAVLLWPLIYRKQKQWQDFALPDADTGFAQRLELCLRAQLLDEVIDTIADYVEAHEVPSVQLEVQSVKRRQHEEALQRYRLLWGR
jgi:thiamine kinase-like enzyme